MRITHLIVGFAALIACACAAREQPPATPATIESAWAAWGAGDALRAREIAEALTADPATENEGAHVAALAGHVLGDYAGAIEHFDGIADGYERKSELYRPIFESYLHLERPEEAQEFADVHELPERLKTRAIAQSDNPLAVTIAGIAELPFEQDPLTPYMPGVAGKVNGEETIFRFDTGGTFVAMSPALAERYGVASSDCAEGFANLQPTQVCYGVATLMLGPVRIKNAPVAVVGALPQEQLGVELGPILGTNFLQRFLATIDAPGQRLILSSRGDKSARKKHMKMIAGEKTQSPFLMWSDHFIIARGGGGDRDDLNYFVDSGLVAVDHDGVQAGLLLPQSEGAAWAGVSDPAVAGTIVTLTQPISLGAAMHDNQRALILPDAAWASFGKFGGMKVNGLISYGFLKDYAWTLDFDQRVITLSDPASSE